MRQHDRTFDALWDNFVQIAEHCLSAHGIVVMEWPAMIAHYPLTPNVVTVERDYVNGEHTSSVVPMTPVGNIPLSTMPWTGRTKYHLRRIDNAAPIS
eukprot:3684766-Amphidinium_carterae.1